MTVRETLRCIVTDIEAFRSRRGIRKGLRGTIFILLNPSLVAIALYRFSHLLHTRGLRSLAWILYDLNLYITGTDIVPTSDIAESFHIAHPVGVIISAKIGKGCTVTGQVGVGGGKADDDVGAGRGLPVIGDDVWFGAGCKVLGPIRVGNGATIGAMSLVLHDVPDGATVYGVPARVMKTASPAAAARLPSGPSAT